MIETLTSEGRAILETVIARQRAKEAAKKAFWEHYHKQLAMGNSNIGSGARHGAHRRIMAHKVC